MNFSKADNECRVQFWNEVVRGYVDVNRDNTLVTAIVVDFPVDNDANRVLRVFCTQGYDGALQQGFYLKGIDGGSANLNVSDHAHRELLESVEDVLKGAIFEEIKVVAGEDKLPVQKFALTILKKFINNADQAEKSLSKLLPPKTKKWLIDVGTRQAFALDTVNAANTSHVPAVPNFLRANRGGQRPNP